MDGIYAVPPGKFEGEKLQPPMEPAGVVLIETQDPEKAWRMFEHKAQITGFNVTSEGYFTLTGNIPLK